MEPRKISWLLFLLGALLLLPATAQASIIDSIQGTTISNTALIRAGNISGETYASAPDTYVAGISGDTLLKPVEAVNGNVGDTIVFTYIIHNTGNAADSFSVSVVNDSYGFGEGLLASGWRVSMFTGADTLYDMATTVDSFPVGLVDEDGIKAFYVAIQVSPNAANAPNGSYWQVNFTVGSETAATAAYTGDGPYSYNYAEATASAGQNNYGCDTVTVAGASFALTKSCTTTLGGVDWTPVPGASLIYTLGYVNDGNGAGDSVAIIDTLDTTVVAFADTMAASDSAPAALWGMQVASGDGIWVDPSAIPTDAVKYLIYWTQTVPALDTGRLRYRVVIR